MQTRTIYTLSVTVAVLAALFAPTWAAQKEVKRTPVLTTNSAELKWAPIDVLPPGAQAAVLASAGDWSVVRVKFPANYVVPPHSHPNAEAVWLISGKVGFGFGDTVDKSGPWLEPGAFFALEAGGHHYVWTGDEGGIIDVQVSDPVSVWARRPAEGETSTIMSSMG